MKHGKLLVGGALAVAFYLLSRSKKLPDRAIVLREPVSSLPLLPFDPVVTQVTAIQYERVIKFGDNPALTQNFFPIFGYINVSSPPEQVRLTYNTKTGEAIFTTVTTPVEQGF